LGRDKHRAWFRIKVAGGRALNLGGPVGMVVVLWFQLRRDLVLGKGLAHAAAPGRRWLELLGVRVLGAALGREKRMVRRRGRLRGRRRKGVVIVSWEVRNLELNLGWYRACDEDGL
jgi:hypothetical protein